MPLSTTSDALAWLEMLFRPGDVFEIRVKTPDERGAQQFWLPFEQRQKFTDIHIPIHEENNRHIWVGVAPRLRVGDATPVLHRALWVDFADTIRTLDQAQAEIERANLPPPTMLVNSGNGFHAYWRLAQDAKPEQVRPYSKGLHAAMSSDSTYDSARVMRVPGTLNPKTDPPTQSRIIAYDPERVYELTAFPRAEIHEAPVVGAKPRQMQPLSDADRDLFVTAWLPGQKHHMAVGVAGYLRKNLYHDRDSAKREIRRIHEAAGYSWEEDRGNLEKAVDDTYDQIFGKVAGLSKLEEFGVVPSVKDAFTFTIKARPKPKIEIIDFTQDIEPQEFWLDGLVGPGLLTLWAAEPKTGKSFAAMQMGYALASGTPLWDFDSDGQMHNVLYFQGELSRGMVYARARSMFGKNALMNSRRFAMTDKPHETISLVEHPEVLIDMAENYDVVIIDPISAFNSNDENSSTSVRETLSVFDRLKAAGKAVVLVHHTKKLQTDREGVPLPPSFSDIRGSSAWFAAVDAIALQYRTGDAGNTKVKFMFRAAPERPPLTLYRMEHGGFTHDRGMYLQTIQGPMRVSLPHEIN